jgi:hypothetical protein
MKIFWPGVSTLSAVSPLALRICAEVTFTPASRYAEAMFATVSPLTTV